jgi:hypothetical protein
LWNAKKKAKVAKKKAKPNWKTIAFASSDIPFYKDSVTDTTPKRMAQLAFEAGVAIADDIKRNQKLQIEMFEPKADPVNNPTHYTVGGIETIDFIEAKKLGYNLGNVVKYITRADHKSNKLQDLRKAQWYLEREIFNVENNKKTA